jgi:hypothetical protein
MPPGVDKKCLTISGSGMPREFRCFVEDAEVVVFDHHSDDGSGVGTSDSQPLPGHHHDAVLRHSSVQAL